ncbi:phage holin family protein [Enterococcus asini]|uniref:phage holin family protein n=1 Tax=Enterococcus asini TaxID=57732 RepID=UPI00266C349E|nr:phage holin family protein [Enterococcus asini]
MTYFQRLVVNTVTFIALTVLMPSQFHVASLLTALIAAFVLSILNGIVRPILVILSLPLNVLSLGLFTFVINGAMLSLTSSLVGANSFGFASFGSALLVAVIMSIVNVIVTEHALDKYSND